MVKPAASFFGDTDNRILLPYGAMQKMYPNARDNAIVVTAKDGRLPALVTPSGRLRFPRESIEEMLKVPAVRERAGEGGTR
jgi:hypothetical protein